MGKADKKSITIELSETDMNIIEDAFFAETDKKWHKKHHKRLCGIWEHLCKAMDKE